MSKCQAVFVIAIDSGRMNPHGYISVGNIQSAEHGEHQKIAVNNDNRMLRSRIVGGKLVPNATIYPYFLWNLSGCAGTLIHEDIVLTAAHCMGSFLTGVYFDGTNRTDSENKFCAVYFEVPHPDSNFLDTLFLNDIMIFRLSSSSTLPVQEINLNVNEPVKHDPVTAIGYGLQMKLA